MQQEEKPGRALQARLASMTNKELIVWDHVLSHVMCIEDEFATLGVTGAPPSPSVSTLIRELRMEFKRRTQANSSHELTTKKGEHHANNNGTH
jgi:hypothetical protein